MNPEESYKEEKRSEGARAYRNGEPFLANPYPSMSLGDVQWREGYISAKNAARREPAPTGLQRELADLERANRALSEATSAYSAALMNLAKRMQG